jgi:hypothetical protein
MQPFVEIDPRRMERPAFVGDPYYGWYGWPYAFWDTVKMLTKHERVPQGELILHRGAQVRATDGLVGQVDALLVDSAARGVTHLVLREGHLWDQADVVIPISQVDYARDDVIYLKLDKKAVGSLPAIPVRRWHSRRKDE